MLKQAYQKLGHTLYFLLKPFTRPVLNRTTRARVVILSGNQIVLVKNWLSQDCWGLPGGGVGKRELADKCAAREVEEEIGLVVDPKKLKYLGQKLHPKTNQNLNYRVEYFLVKFKTKPAINIKNPWEITEIDWFSVDKLPKSISPTVDAALKLAVKASLLP